MQIEDVMWTMLATGCIMLADAEKHNEAMKEMYGGKEEYFNICKRFINQFFRYYNEKVPFDNVPYDNNEIQDKIIKNSD